MSDAMGSFRITVQIENPLRAGERRTIVDALVDTGSELTWAPRAVLESLGITSRKKLGFRLADGRPVWRDVGYAIVHAAGTETNDEVVFAEPGDTILLGARSLEGMNLRVDVRNKQLVDAGPIVASSGSVAKDARRGSPASRALSHFSNPCAAAPADRRAR